MRSACYAMIFLGCLMNCHGARNVANRQEVQNIQRLEKGVLQIESEYKTIFEAYAKLKAAPRAEYAFYSFKLKLAVVEAIESEKLGKGLGYGDIYPLSKFTTQIVLNHIKLLESNRLNLAETELTKKADNLVLLLKEIRYAVL